MRLIDADALELEADQHNVMNGVAFVGQRGGGRTLEIVKRLLKHMIDNAPTIEAVPVVHGRWVYGVTLNHEWRKCSECLVSQEIFGCFTYCPNCGAKMDGGEPDAH